MKLYPPRAGEALFTKKQLTSLLIPLIMEQIFTSVIGMADSVMVAQVGESAMSGVSLVDSVNILLINIFAALATGGTIITSQYLGRKDLENARASARQGILATVSLAGIICIFCLFFRRGILSFIFGAVEQSVMENALVYFLITAMAYPFIALFGSCSAIFRATGNAKLPMRVSLIMNVINVCGNAVLIFVFNMGAAGAALATLASRIFAGVTMYIKLCSPELDVNVRGLFSQGFDWKMIRRILGIGIPNGIENGIFQVGKVLVQSILSMLGTNSIAAGAIAHHAATVIVMPGQAIGLGLVTVGGQCVGAGKYDQARRYAVGFTGLCEASILVIGAALLIFMNAIISIFGVTAETAEIARSLISCTVIGAMILWPLAFTLPNILRASGDVRFTMVISVFSMWAFRIGLGYILAVPLDIGAPGIWYGMMVDWVFRTAAYVLRFAGEKWTRHRVLGTK